MFQAAGMIVQQISGHFSEIFQILLQVSKLAQKLIEYHFFKKYVSHVKIRKFKMAAIFKIAAVSGT